MVGTTEVILIQVHPVLGNMNLSEIYLMLESNVSFIIPQFCRIYCRGNNGTQKRPVLQSRFLHHQP